MSFQIYVNKEQEKYVSVLEFVNNLYKHASPQAALKVILNYLFERYQKPINDLELYKKEESSGQLTFHLIDVPSSETSRSILQRINKCLDGTQIGLNFSDECLRPYKEYYFKFTDASEFYSYLRANDSESELTEDRARELFKEGAIKKLAVNDKRNTAFMNNSLASYVSEYTLPQVVALILNIDLADITTNPSNSYINDLNKYGEGVYQKFENLLQSYSVAALNNKLDGVDLITRTVKTYGGDTETHIDLEKTTIGKSNLASYLSSIGCNLDDLIAKQEPIHNQNNNYQQNDPELVSSLQQQVVDLQTCIDEKDKDLKAKSEELDAALKKVKQAGATGSDNEPLNERSERSYLNTIGLLIEVMTEPRTEGGTAPFASEAMVIAKIAEKDIYGQKKTKLGERFKEAKDALADEKKKKR